MNEGTALALVIIICMSIFFNDTLRQRHIENTKLEYISTGPSKDERMWNLFRSQCKAKYPPEYVSKVVDCTVEKMRAYLNQDNTN